MKAKKFLWIVLALTAFCFMGCFSLLNALTTKKPVPVQFSFAEDQDKNRTAAITFVGGNKAGVRLVDCEGVTRPAPAEGTYWETAILFPAEKPLNLRVYVYWKEDQFGERRRGIFRCPPLEAGREYKLWFKGNLKGGSLILTDANVGYLSGKQNIVHEQKIPPPPKAK